ncbi:carbonic anhydrase [Afifella sp. IM 167]|uniref:carbonic anhydrase n=1 Tax=Afifella sp. IM 167 TaxID=2033586 RepID=UPI001CCCED9E|nr:carbonic anhydrase [Afifella sp. IM 167]MBZ8134536.1 carbonate dehydratase [Afifella sp. IM 167]
MSCMNALRSSAALALCLGLAGVALAEEGAHWSYDGKTGPEHWGEIDQKAKACGTGMHQSPIDISGAEDKNLPEIELSWRDGAGTMVNNGHTIQVNMPEGSTLARSDATYQLLQFHFHAPSEHTVDGKHFPMEAHFVHKNAANDRLGVLGVFLVPGGENAAFKQLAAAFPAEAGQEMALRDVDAAGLVPSSLDYWSYEGSLTTPPCSEIVDWMVVKEPMQVAQDDIDRFLALYDMNARPTLPGNGRMVIGSK